VWGSPFQGSGFAVERFGVWDAVEGFGVWGAVEGFGVWGAVEGFGVGGLVGTWGLEGLEFEMTTEHLMHHTVQCSARNICSIRVHQMFSEGFALWGGYPGGALRPSPALFFDAWMGLRY